MSTNAKLMSLRIVIGIAIVNFLVFFVVAVYLGGDAVNGSVQNGHFYLASHGKHTEVSEAIFNYSKIHVHSIWVTHPLGMVAAYLYLRLKRAQQSISAAGPAAPGRRCP